MKSHRLLLITRVLLVIPIGLLSSPALAEAKNDSSAKPAATNSDIFLYRGLGASYVCNALRIGVEFPKSVGIAAATYTQVLNGRHAGKIASSGDKKLSNKQLFMGAEFQLVNAAVEYCPKLVPEDVKKKVAKANKELIDREKKKRK
ncbi:cAMP phosphodiesterase [Prochlorococcus sp. MIT 1341]|uniref:cAMP phosphodiesterase n=1 Tax=Prochlorococcus sp. MIT 1341 TaxID=3096221 RepID=UPI002A75BB13|nr:cAMP phosphodiesterase [Prochlorococcus sp. MIT 1341]